MQPPKSIRGRFVTRIKAALADGQSPEAVCAAITRCVEEGVGPASFDETLWKIQSEIGARRDGRDLLAAYLAANGGRWPTGSRLVRGTHSGTYIPDPLGVDKPPYHVPWERPNREAVVEALRKKGDEDEGQRADP